MCVCLCSTSVYYPKWKEKYFLFHTSASISWVVAAVLKKKNFCFFKKYFLEIIINNTQAVYFPYLLFPVIFSLDFFLRQHCKYSYIINTWQNSTKAVVTGYFMFLERGVIVRGWVMREMRIKETKTKGRGVREQSLPLNVCWVIHSLSTRTLDGLRVSG